MVPMGVSPVEAAFEVIGLVNAKSIMDFLFFDTQIGVAVFFIGLLTSLWKSVRETNFSALGSFLIVFFILLFVFIKPMFNLEDATSTMEEAGWKGDSTAQSLKDTFFDTGKTQAGSLGLVFISEIYNSIVYGTVSAITRVTQQGNFNYLNNPFIVNKVSLYLQHFSAEGIKDNALRKDLEDFLRNDYPQTIGRMINNSTNQPADMTKKWWPGDGEVIANYDPDQKSRWEDLDTRLDTYIKENLDTISSNGPLANLLIDYKALKIKLLSAHMESSAQDIASNISGYGIDSVSPHVSWLAKQPAKWFAYISSFIGQFFSTTLAEFMIKALPYLEGYAVMIIYSLFPFTVLLSLLLGTMDILKEYFVYLFWVKSWVIVWALIHYASLYMSTLQAKLQSGASGSWFFEKPYFNIVTGVLLVMSPGIAWFMTKGVLSGIGEAATALTLHADKGVGKAGSKIGV